MKLRKFTILELIVQYQVANRQAGHTTVMMHGLVPNKDAILVVAGMNHREYMKNELIRNGWSPQEADNSLVMLHQIKNGYLKNIRRRPLVLDNLTLFEMAMDVAENRKELFEELAKAERAE